MCIFVLVIFFGIELLFWKMYFFFVNLLTNFIQILIVFFLLFPLIYLMKVAFTITKTKGKSEISNKRIFERIIRLIAYDFFCRFIRFFFHTFYLRLVYYVCGVYSLLAHATINIEMSQGQRHVLVSFAS